MSEEFLGQLAGLLNGAVWTLALCSSAGIAGTAFGFVLGLGQTSSRAILRWPAVVYVTVVRGVPVLLLIFFVYFGVPLLFGVNLDPFLTGFLSLALVGAAYTGEIFRGAIEAVPRGQTEAAHALGLGYADRLFRVIMPQALRIAVPAGTGFLINLVKDSSLIGIIGFVELTRAAKILSNLTLDPLGAFLMAAAIYFVISFVISRTGNAIERRLTPKLGKRARIQESSLTPTGH
ncbi:amino acid ABC transporter permease [Mycetocola sp. 2940]|uniref:amino acid ABC transporter permease n=1 Tax=Mycetocola sp. 2940 TaxID=3156452 RepID=UPI0033945964